VLVPGKLLLAAVPYELNGAVPNVDPVEYPGTPNCDLFDPSFAGTCDAVDEGWYEPNVPNGALEDEGW